MSLRFVRTGSKAALGQRSKEGIARLVWKDTVMRRERIAASLRWLACSEHHTLTMAGFDS
jgi:hypothetical protein